jgi:hypothetical protein
MIDPRPLHTCDGEPISNGQAQSVLTAWYGSAIIALFSGIIGSSIAAAADVTFDVNDVTFLWPPPQSQAEMDRLISADTAKPGETDAIWPADSFKAVIAETSKIAVTNSAGRMNKIDFRPFTQDFEIQSNWKIVSVRVDPSAPGTKPMFTSAFGQLPQVRLVLQPVTTTEDGQPKVHDVAVHLVFNFAERFDPPASPTSPPIAVPDRVTFKAMVQDLLQLKRGLAQKGITTAGKLSIHPGFKHDAEAFGNEFRAFLHKHLSDDRLAAVAFMGIDTPEPWIFFAMRKKDGALGLQPFATLGGQTAQMLTFRGGTAVMPPPVSTNVDETHGVSTALLFDRTISERLEKPVFDDMPTLQFRDVPDLIANPERAHFFNTDCVSCHSESARRVDLGLSSFISQLRYNRPEGLSPVDDTLLPDDHWNVRNLGWFPKAGGPAVATITVRTANEAAESADFINRNYLAGDTNGK